MEAVSAANFLLQARRAGWLGLEFRRQVSDAIVVNVVGWGPGQFKPGSGEKTFSEG